MQRDALLTQDELDFIQTMQHNPQLNVRDATSSLLVNCLLYTSPSPRD